MFDWVPLTSYGNIYNYIILLLILATSLLLFKYKLENGENLAYWNLFGYTLLFFTILYIGQRPVSEVFIDMPAYVNIFNRLKDSPEFPDIKSELLFNYTTYILAKKVSIQTYFQIIALAYILPLYVVSKKLFKNRFYLSLLFLFCSFSFWAYGVNGVRNGMATSIFLLVFVTQKNWLKLLIMFLAWSIHGSMAIPIVAYWIAYYFKRPKYIFYFWLTCIPISLLFGEQIQVLFSGFADDRRSKYLTDQAEADIFAHVGFRWDFLLYSASAIVFAAYFIFKLKFKDRLYDIIVFTYIISNAIWILVIRANFSNRFAYLSWFMMALVFTYPLLNIRTMKKKYPKIILILIAYFAFTFIMNLILPNLK
jgi:hypothetical protein